MNDSKFYTMVLSHFILYIPKKVEKKNRTKAVLDEIIFWLKGYNEKTLPAKRGYWNVKDLPSLRKLFFYNLASDNPPSIIKT
jgi:hypothetical protein